MGLLAEVGRSILDVGDMRQLVLIPRAHLLLLSVVLELLIVGLLVQVLQVLLLFGISVI